MDSSVSNIDNFSPALASKRVVVDFLWDYGYGQEMAKGLQRYRSLHPEQSFVPTPLADLGRLEPGSVQGAIGHYGSREAYERLQEAGIPYLVNVSNREDLPVWRRLLADDEAVGRMAADYFLKKGYRNFAVIGPDAHQYAVDRRKGFEDTLARAGFTDVLRLPRPLLECFTDSPLPLPLALFAVSDRIAMTALIHLQKLGLNVPGDVAVLGVDDDAMVAPLVPVPLSSIRLPLEKIGFDACMAMNRMIRAGKPSTEITRYAPLGIVERRSSETTAVSDPVVRKATDWMRERLTQLQDIEELAGALHMHRRSLDRHFVRATGITPWEWLQRQRADYAVRLLQETDDTVDVIAELAGFETPVRLYRAFKKYGKPLPSVVRKEQMR